MLKQCPYCTNMIDANVEYCPHCRAKNIKDYSIEDYSNNFKDHTHDGEELCRDDDRRIAYSAHASSNQPSNQHIAYTPSSFANAVINTAVDIENAKLEDNRKMREAIKGSHNPYLCFLLKLGLLFAAYWISSHYLYTWIISLILESDDMDLIKFVFECMQEYGTSNIRNIFVIALTLVIHLFITLPIVNSILRKTSRTKK